MEKTIRIGLVGNPNVGKSTVFNALTGLKQHTGNWTGKTVTNAVGNFIYHGKEYELVDLPGTYSLVAHSAEEEVTRDFVWQGKYDQILVVCDAVCLERNLNLVLQIRDITKQVIVCVNLMDEAKKKKIQIDLPQLAAELGLPVVGMSARQGEGLEQLKQQLESSLAESVAQNGIGNVTESMAQNGKGNMTENIGENVATSRERKMISLAREEEILQEAERIAKKVVSFQEKNYDKVDRKWDALLANRITGIPIMLAMLGLILWLTIQGANYPSQVLSEGLFWLGDKLEIFLIWCHIPAVMVDMLINGMYRVLAWVVAVMLPPMAIFFPLFTLLEDLGVLPRIAFHLDGVFKKCCACGKQALTMCMGFGCNACGVTGCRIIDSPRERLIAILTNAFIPCNGRFPTLISIITMFLVGTSAGLWSSLEGVVLLLGLIVCSVLVTFFVSKILSKTVLQGKPSSFLLELPPYRKPQIGKVIVRSIFDRTLFVLGRAITVAAPAGILIWCLANIEVDGVAILTHITTFLDPFAVWLGMDGVILTAFLLGFPANEIVIPIILMTYLSTGELTEMSNIMALKEVLLAHGWTTVTAICVMVFSLFHWPCSTTCLTIKKETGSWKWTALGFALPTAVGMLLCFGIHLVSLLVM